MPPMNKNPALELFLHKLDGAIKETAEKPGFGDNLTSQERKALNEMKRWKEVVIIRPYDKGVGFVVDDLINYKNRVQAEILNPNTYQFVEDPSTAISQINEKISKW